MTTPRCVEKQEKQVVQIRDNSVSRFCDSLIGLKLVFGQTYGWTYKCGSWNRHLDQIFEIIFSRVQEGWFIVLQCSGWQRVASLGIQINGFPQMLTQVLNSHTTQRDFKSQIGHTIQTVQDSVSFMGVQGLPKAHTFRG